MQSGARIVITGSSGFIGANAVEYFLGRHFEVLGTDLITPRRASRALFVECDLLDGEKLKKLFVNFNPDYVLHLGARTDTFERHSLSGYAANIEGVGHVIDACNACSNLRRVIITSSRLVCRIEYIPRSDEDFCPPNYYGQSKVRTEQITKSSTINAEWLITRPTAIWGPGFLVPSYRDFFEQIRRGTYVHIGHENPLKTFGYVKNCVYQIEQLFMAPKERIHKRIFYLGDYQPIALRDWADLIAREFGRRPIPSIPRRLVRAGARVGDVLKSLGWDNVPLTTYRFNNMLCPAVFDLRALQEIAGPLPFDLEIGTRETVDWLKRNP